MSVTLEQRVAKLEKQMAELQRQESNRFPWLDQIYGKYKEDDPFIQAMKLGSEYRASLRPRPRKARPAAKSKR